MTTEPMQTSHQESMNVNRSGRKYTLYDEIRLCRLPECKAPFRPKRKDQSFHTEKCRKQYHSLAYKMGQAALNVKIGFVGQEDIHQENPLPPPTLQSSYLKDSPASWAGLEGEFKPGGQTNNHHQEVDYADRDKR